MVMAETGTRSPHTNTSAGGTRCARRAAVAAMSPGLVTDPHGDTAFVASDTNIAAYSVADGTALCTEPATMLLDEQDASRVSGRGIVPEIFTPEIISPHRV